MTLFYHRLDPLHQSVLIGWIGVENKEQKKTPRPKTVLSGGHFWR